MSESLGCPVSLSQKCALTTPQSDSVYADWVITCIQIDEMEHILQISSAALRGYHNTLIPVNRIPPEVMPAMIFANMQQRLPSFVSIPETGEYGDQHRSWLAVVHVCRHWRGIAATFPVLWSSIDSHIIPRTFLRRSKSVPLSLYLDVRHPQPGITPGLIKSLARQSHRIEPYFVKVGWRILTL